MSSSPPFRDYLPAGAPLPEPAPSETALPRPGHGRVWINGPTDHEWYASWQDAEAVQDSPMGTRERVIAAARSMPAADRVIFSRPDGDHVDLDEWLARPT